MSTKNPSKKEREFLSAETRDRALIPGESTQEGASFENVLSKLMEPKKRWQKKKILTGKPKIFARRHKKRG